MITLLSDIVMYGSLYSFSHSLVYKYNVSIVPWLDFLSIFNFPCIVPYSSSSAWNMEGCCNEELLSHISLLQVCPE